MTSGPMEGLVCWLRYIQVKYIRHPKPGIRFCCFCFSMASTVFTWLFMILKTTCLPSNTQSWQHRWKIFLVAKFIKEFQEAQQPSSEECVRKYNLNIYLIFLQLCIVVWGGWGAAHSTYVVVRGKLSEVDSLLLPYKSQEWDTGCQTWQQISLPTELSGLPISIFFLFIDAVRKIN